MSAPQPGAESSAGHTRASQSSPAPGHPTPDRRGLALTVLLIPAALTLLSVTSVNVALPSLRDGLGAGPAGQSLVLTAYAVAFALVLLLAGSGAGIFVGPNTNASFVQTPGPQAGVASALVTVAQRAGTAVGIGILSLLFATLPGGPTAMGTQATAAFTSAGLVLVAAAVMVLTRRAALERELG